MFNLRKKNKPSVGLDEDEAKAPVADSMKRALVKYYEAAVKECNKQFAQTWPFDPDWVDLLGVAHDLDQVNGNTGKMQEIQDTIMKSFFDSDNIDKCVSSLLILHLSNQRQLEDYMRHSGNGKLFIPE